MKRILLLLFTVCTPLFGIWSVVPLGDLIRESDTIITGTLTGVKTWTKDEVDHGSGTLVIGEEIKGAPKTKELSLVWQNQSDFVCPRIEHKHSEGKVLVWLLQTNAVDGSVEADYPDKVLALSERPNVEAKLMAVKFNLAIPAKPDDELAKLEKALAEAMTQTEMNLCSGAIGQHLDARFMRLEERIARDLDSEARALFQQAARAWREYRAAQVAFEGDLYCGGSIQPLIHNRTFNRLIKERLDALRHLNPQGDYRNY